MQLADHLAGLVTPLPAALRRCSRLRRVTFDGLLRSRGIGCPQLGLDDIADVFGNAWQIAGGMLYDDGLELRIAEQPRVHVSGTFEWCCDDDQRSNTNLLKSSCIVHTARGAGPSGPDSSHNDIEVPRELLDQIRRGSA